MRRRRAQLSVLLLPILLCAGCRPSSPREVIVYSALDQEFAAPILAEFEQDTGIAVQPVYDVESTKTVGLYNRLLHERRRPQCDVFWNNEILHTLRLEREGLLDAYLSPSAAEFPENYRPGSAMWTGFAARARVLLINTEVLPEQADWPTSIRDLADDRWQGQAGMARPLFGTTATHAAVLFSVWGREAAEEYFRAVSDHAVVLSGNKQVAMAVARGELAFGITDTDDAIIEREAGCPVVIVFPDQQPDQLGTLFIPNTLAILRGAPHPQHARELVDYLLRPSVERKLQAGPSAQIPVNPAVERSNRAFDVRDVRWMDVDFKAAAASWDSAAEFLHRVYERGE